MGERIQEWGQEVELMEDKGWIGMWALIEEDKGFGENILDCMAFRVYISTYLA